MAGNMAGNLALVTGASSGIGEALARVHAAHGGDLVLVARSAARLQQLKVELEAAHSVHVTILCEDLAEPGAAARVFRQTEAAGLQVDVLINNAGVGGHGKFHERGLEADQQMMQLNIITLAELTYYYVQGMVARGAGRILNVSSTAGFLPGPLQAVYYASKAFVNSFSQALANELQGTGVTVTALCPGPVDTGFKAAADLDGVRMMDLAVSATSVAEFGYRAMQRGQLVAINQPALRLLLGWIMPFLPRGLLLKFSRRAMEKSA